MTRSEKEAMNAYKRDLIKQGIDKKIAAAMAAAMVSAGVVKPVVYVENGITVGRK